MSSSRSDGRADEETRVIHHKGKNHLITRPANHVPEHNKVIGGKEYVVPGHMDGYTPCGEIMVDGSDPAAGWSNTMPAPDYSDPEVIARHPQPPAVATREIASMLMLSTRHVDPVVLNLLKVYPSSRTGAYEKDEYGWFVNVPCREEDGSMAFRGEVGTSLLMGSLRDVLRYARGLGCDWVTLDRDCDEVSDLRTYD